MILFSHTVYLLWPEADYAVFILTEDFMHHKLRTRRGRHREEVLSHREDGADVNINSERSV